MEWSGVVWCCVVLCYVVYRSGFVIRIIIVNQVNLVHYIMNGSLSTAISVEATVS